MPVAGMQPFDVIAGPLDYVASHGPILADDRSCTKPTDRCGSEIWKVITNSAVGTESKCTSNIILSDGKCKTTKQHGIVVNDTVDNSETSD